MPKKTKKEKLLAQHHRVHLPTFVPESRSMEPAQTASPFHLTLPMSMPTRPSATAIASSVDGFAAIQHDLAKTLVITIGIIVSEFLLSHYLPK